MRDFKSYSQNTNNEQHRQGQGSGDACSGDVNGAINMATMLAQACAGKSEGQIWQTILAQAEQGKRNGTLTNTDLDNFFAAVAPYMDGFKRKKLSQIIGRLKSL